MLPGISTLVNTRWMFGRASRMAMASSALAAPTPSLTGGHDEVERIHQNKRAVLNYKDDWVTH